MASQYDWKGNTSLLNPWTKWMRRNVIYPISNGERAIRRPLRSSPSNSAPPRRIKQIEEPPSPENLLPMLTKDDKYYLIGQKLSSLLSQDQQKRLLQDALSAGRLPPANNGDSQNCICPDILVELQNLIRAEFDLVQNHCLAAQPPTVVIHQPTFNTPGFEKPLPGLPAQDWQAAGSYSYLYNHNWNEPSQTSPILDGNTSTSTAQSQAAAVARLQPKSRQNLELTSIRFPKIGPEPRLYCEPCQTEHPTRLFSTTQRRLPARERRCIAREGYVRLCAHKVVTWDLVEGCLMKSLGHGGPDESGHGTVNEDGNGGQEGGGIFTFTCQHASHMKEAVVERAGVVQFPRVIIYGSRGHGSGLRANDKRFDQTFGRIMLKWSTTGPSCNRQFPGSITELSTSGPSFSTFASQEDTANLLSHTRKDVICPGPLSRHTLPARGPDALPIHDHPPWRYSLEQSQARSGGPSRLSYQTVNDTISSYSPSYMSSPSSYSMVRPDSRASILTDNDSDCQCNATTPSTPIFANPITQGLNQQLTLRAVDVCLSADCEPENSSDQQSMYLSPEEPGLQIGSNSNTIEKLHHLNPSSEWFAALHPDSYSLDKWGKEGLFGLRWCTEPECKSYLAMD